MEPGQWEIAMVFVAFLLSLHIVQYHSSKFSLQVHRNYLNMLIISLVWEQKVSHYVLKNSTRHWWISVSGWVVVIGEGDSRLAISLSLIFVYEIAMEVLGETLTSPSIGTSHPWHMGSWQIVHCVPYKFIEKKLTKLAKEQSLMSLVDLKNYLPTFWTV